MNDVAITNRAIAVRRDTGTTVIVHDALNDGAATRNNKSAEVEIADNDALIKQAVQAGKNSAVRVGIDGGVFNRATVRDDDASAIVRDRHAINHGAVGAEDHSVAVVERNRRAADLGQRAG